MAFMKTGTPVPFHQVTVCPNCGVVIDSDVCHVCGHQIK